MATIVNGLLISARKSAGGMNFYKRLGVQCIRNKPVRNPGYVQSAAQDQQNSVFSLVSAFKNSTAGMDALIRGGWGASVSGKGRTPFNNWSSAVLKAVTRDADGALLVGADREASIEAFTSNPGKVFRDNCPLVKSKFANLGEGVTAAISGTAGSETITVTIPAEVLAAWKQTLPTSYQNAADVSGDIVYMNSAAMGETETAAFLTATPSESGTEVTVSFAAGEIAANDEIRLAYGAAPAAVGSFGQDANFAIGSIGLIAVAAGA